MAIARNASGLPLTITQGGRTRALRYNPDHRLIEVRQNGQLLARYGHNTHGQRISKLVGPQTPASQAQTFLWSQGQLSAEGHGQAIDRRYVYAHGVPVAVIDHPGGASAITPAEGPWSALLQWAQAVWRVAATPAPQLTYLHSNEIGTPVAATGARGQLLWQAEHSAFGELRALRTEHRPGHAPQDGVKGFALNLRLPGQYFDAETGWHDNVLRTYDPQRGQYLEPDPLGPTPNWHRGTGPWLTQPFAYANHNPITYADPNGLILFAFDGTGNSNDPEQLASLGNGISNVWQFRQLYADGNRRYISGVGTIDTSDPARPINPKDYVPLAAKLLPVATIVEKDMALNYSGRARITRMEEYFNQEAELFLQNDKAMNVDIVGFSRGAAQAREFANIIANKTNADGYYQYTIKDGAGKVVNKCQKVNFRFMGLWDTVLSTDGVFFGSGYNLSVSEKFNYVAQAVALNEYRGDTLRTLPNSTGAFPLESIVGSAAPVAGGVRIERGFIGSHADIGGGYVGTGQQTDLAKVPLAWMIEQAKLAGVQMTKTSGDSVHATAVIHDKSDEQYARDKVVKPSDSDEQREVHYMNGTKTKIKSMTGTGMTYADTQKDDIIQLNPPGVGKIEYDLAGNPIITYAAKPADYSAGTVNMKKYLDWLTANGYTLGNLHVQ